MAKITLNNVTSGFQSGSAHNTNNDAIEAEFQDKVLYRDNPDGEPNQMENDLDMNSNDITNAGSISGTNITIAGTSLQSKLDEASASATSAQTAQSLAETARIAAETAESNATAIVGVTTDDFLPDQTGAANKYLRSNGTIGVWVDGTDGLPDQTGQSGNYLTSDGTNASWAVVDSLPNQSGQSGNFLTTDGSSASWSSVDALPSQSGQSGNYLTTNGSAASWNTIATPQISQVISTTTSSQTLSTTRGTTSVVNGMSITITPRSSASKFLLIGFWRGSGTSTFSNYWFGFDRTVNSATTNLGRATSVGSRQNYGISTADQPYASSQSVVKMTWEGVFVDEPATTSSITYDMTVAPNSTGVNVLHNGYSYLSDGDNLNSQRFPFYFIVQEIL